MIERFHTYSGESWTGFNRACTNASCTTDCCAFPSDRKGYFIILQPGEMAFAQSLRVSTDHLTIVDADFFGGQKAVCTAKNKLICDFGWKPFDCRMHPVFPCVGQDGDFYYKYDPHCAAFTNENFIWHLAGVARLLVDQFFERPHLMQFYRDCAQDPDDLSPLRPFKDLTYHMQKRLRYIQHNQS